jgi:hypothetical protein
MMKAKVSKNLISFQLIRRKDWLLKISVFHDKYVLLVAQHCFYHEQVFTKYFSDFEQAASFVDFLIEQDYYDSENF